MCSLHRRQGGQAVSCLEACTHRRELPQLLLTTNQPPEQAGGDRASTATVVQHAQTASYGAGSTCEVAGGMESIVWAADAAHVGCVGKHLHMRVLRALQSARSGAWGRLDCVQLSRASRRQQQNQGPDGRCDKQAGRGPGVAPRRQGSPARRGTQAARRHPHILRVALCVAQEGVVLPRGMPVCSTARDVGLRSCVSLQRHAPARPGWPGGCTCKPTLRCRCGRHGWYRSTCWGHPHPSLPRT